MNSLNLTPDNHLPELTPEDQEFAEKISEEYNLPMDEISQQIRLIRSELQDDYSEFLKDSRLKETYQELFGSGNEIRGIIIKTNKGSIDIKITDSIYDQYFKDPIRMIKRNFKETLEDELVFLHGLTIRSLFSRIIFYFEGTNLNKMQTNNAIFDYIQYFKIGGPVKTEDDWNKNPTEDQTYRHYKNGIIKNRKKLYLRDPNKPK